MQRKLEKIRKNANKCTDLKNDIIYLEQYLQANINSIFSDEELNVEFSKIMNLDIDERRLYLVYILLNQSVIKTSKYFQVDRKTVSLIIKSIKDKLGYK
jgi:hypothetical protein